MSLDHLPPLPFDCDVIIHDPLWAEHCSDPAGLCRRALQAASLILDAPLMGEVSIAFMDDAAMTTLNRTYRNQDKPTNVLSFPDHGPAPLLGDIALARETVIREALEKSVPVRDHLTHLVIHGFLHLQGYDHMETDEAAIMEGLEIQALAVLDIDNPYENEEPA